MKMKREKAEKRTYGMKRKGNRRKSKENMEMLLKNNGRDVQDPRRKVGLNFVQPEYPVSQGQNSENVCDVLRNVEAVVTGVFKVVTV